MTNISHHCEQILSGFLAKPDSISANACLHGLVAVIGPGFHPDTTFFDYVDYNCIPLFESHVSARLDDLFKALLIFLDANGIDPCEICLEPQQAMFDDPASLD